MANEVYKKLTQNMVDECYKYTRDIDVTDKAHIVKSNLDKINEAFYKVHTAISHTRKVSDDKIEEVQADIDKYITTYLTFFPGKLISKQHILHRHCTPFIKRHGFGLGLTGEQSTESSHQVISRIKKRATSIMNKYDRLEFVMNTHILGTSPILVSDKEKKTRKRKLKL